MKKALFLMALAAAQTVGAQQLANSTFDAAWVNCYPWAAGKTTSTAKGTQPEGWCISNVPDASSLATLPILGSVETGANGTGKSVKLTNNSASGQNIPAYITLGTTWATAEVQGLPTDVRNEDGGVFGGIEFTYHPDAVRLSYMCDRSAGAENISVVAYLWKGKWTQTNVPSNTAVKYMFGYGTATKVTMYDRINNILGKETLTGDIPPTHTDDAALIASVEYYSNAAQSTWKTQEFPLNYGEYAGQPVNVEKFNIVVAACGIFDDRSLIKSGNSITIDDVELVYWHGLSDLSYEGATLAFDEETTNYDLSSVFYDEAKLSYVIKGQAATATKSYNPETAVLTICVEGEDIDSNPDSYTEYTVQFKKLELISSKTYSEDIYVTINGNTMDKQVANVLVETYNDGTIDFVLKNFVCFIDGQPMPVGNIAVSGIPVASDGSFAFNDGIQIANGDDSAYEQWAGPMVTELCGGSVPLDLNGKFIGEDHVIVTIAIDVSSALGQVINVHLGYARLESGAMTVFSDAQYGTFCAPFAVEIPEGVKAYTVPSVTGGVLDLNELTGTIPANTPVVLYSELEDGYFSPDLFGVVEEGTPKVGLLTGVYEDGYVPVGSYVLQLKYLDEESYKVGFYKVVEDAPLYIYPNRCYLTVPASGGIKEAFFFNEDDATGIKAMVNGQWSMDNGIYNLAGQRMSKMQKGINIVNGKKILK